MLDETVAFGEFREQLGTLYDRLKNEAKLSSYEGFELDVIGNGNGGIEVRVRAVGEHVPLIQLTFAFHIDQSYLPAIIEQIDAEFPPPYRAAV